MEEFNQRSLDTIFIVDDLVILFVLFSLCGFELLCNALDNLPKGTHLEFPFGGVSTNDEFFIFPFLAILFSFLFLFSSLLILFLLFVSL